MTKKVRYNETVKQWSAVAIVREEGQLKEVSIGVVQTEKKLKETGVKELFKNLGLIPANTITIEVEKNADVVTAYEVDVEKFKEIAQVVKVDESHDTEEAEIQE